MEQVQVAAATAAREEDVRRWFHCIVLILSLLPRSRILAGLMLLRVPNNSARFETVLCSKDDMVAAHLKLQLDRIRRPATVARVETTLELDFEELQGRCW